MLLVKGILLENWQSPAGRSLSDMASWYSSVYIDVWPSIYNVTSINQYVCSKCGMIFLYIYICICIYVYVYICMRICSRMLSFPTTTESSPLHPKHKRDLRAQIMIGCVVSSHLLYWWATSYTHLWILHYVLPIIEHGIALPSMPINCLSITHRLFIACMLILEEVPVECLVCFGIVKSHLVENHLDELVWWDARTG